MCVQHRVFSLKWPRTDILPKYDLLTNGSCFINTPRCAYCMKVWYTGLPLVSLSYLGEISDLGLVMKQHTGCHT